MNTNKHYQAAVFDLDGTLLDTLPSLATATNEVLMAQGQLPVSEVELRASLSEGLSQLFAHAWAVQRDPRLTQEEFVQACQQRYLKNWLSEARPYPSVGAVLRELRDVGTKLAVCTNRDRASTQALLDATGWTNLFDAVVTRDDVRQPKPFPDPLLQVLAQLDVPASDVLMVGDSRLDRLCAEAAFADFAAHAGGYALVAADLVPCTFSFERYEDFTEQLRTRRLSSKEMSHV